MERKLLDNTFRQKPENPQEQFALLKKAADSGERDAAAYVAYSEYLGIGIEINKEKALKDLDALCRDDVPCAYAVLGRICILDSRFDDAFKCFEKANKLDEGLVSGELAVCYLKGKGTDKDYLKAKRFFKLAIKEGSHRGLSNYYLGLMAFEGLGMERDISTAKKYATDAMQDEEGKKKAEKLLGKIKQEENLQKKKYYAFVLAGVIGLCAFIALSILVCNRLGKGEKEEEVNTTENQLTLANDIVEETETSQPVKLVNEDVKDKITKKAQYFENEINEIYVGYTEVSEDSKTAIKVYASALANLYYDELPVGISEDELDSTFTQYALEDVDQDQILDLILVNKNEDNLYMSEAICGYDVVSGGLVVKWKGLPYATCYTNGVITTESTVLQNMPKGFTPYQFYELDQNNIYQYKGYVECWDKSIAETNSNGEAFPEEEDTDGDGVVFVIIDSDYQAIYYDSDMFDKFEKTLIGESKPVKVVYTEKK